jgi:hypothetical protein
VEQARLVPDDKERWRRPDRMLNGQPDIARVLWKVEDLDGIDGLPERHSRGQGRNRAILRFESTLPMT